MPSCRGRTRRILGTNVCAAERRAPIYIYHMCAAARCEGCGRRDALALFKRCRRPCSGTVVCQCAVPRAAARAAVSLVCVCQVCVFVCSCTCVCPEGHARLSAPSRHGTCAPGPVRAHALSSLDKARSHHAMMLRRAGPPVWDCARQPILCA